jgi:hypothetical protein
MMVYIGVKYPDDMEAKAYDFLRLLEDELSDPDMDPRVEVELRVAHGGEMRVD